MPDVLATGHTKAAAPNGDARGITDGDAEHPNSGIPSADFARALVAVVCWGDRMQIIHVWRIAAGWLGPAADVLAAVRGESPEHHDLRVLGRLAAAQQ